MKTLGYLIFAGFYYVFRFLCPIQSKKVFGIMTHDASIDGNVGSMIEYLNGLKQGYKFHTIKKADRKRVKDFRMIKGMISFFIVKPYHLATSKYILLDNAFLPMAYIKFAKRVRVVQLWHGTGTIKKFGQDVNTGDLKKLEKRANSRITHLVVNSEETKKEYASAFGVEEDKIIICGLPRTDLFFNKDKIEDRKQKFYQQYPQLVGKKLVLYAPTFRDQEADSPKMALDTDKLCESLPQDYVYLLRLHPFVAEAYKRSGTMKTSVDEKVISMSAYRDINTLFLVSDYLITDYSSVIFEYCLMEKPMLFYAYDLEEFSNHGRGFYRDYEKYVPGPVVRDTQAIIDILNKNQLDYDKIRKFVKENYKYFDGKSAERLYLHIFKDKQT